MKKNTIYYYDTTLRDGSQAEGVSFSLIDKIKITELLDRLGISYIEGGWPGSNPKDVAESPFKPTWIMESISSITLALTNAQPRTTHDPIFQQKQSTD